jgi:hypothetical protein
MTTQELVNQLLVLVQGVHPEYTREQQWTWITAVLAYTVLEKNHMDNIVLARLNQRLRYIANRT